MAEEFLNPDGLEKRQQLIEHILRLLGMSERPSSSGAKKKRGSQRRGVGEPKLETPCRPISAQSLRPTRIRCEENGLSFTYGQVTWIGIPIG